jgi:hypothetical protein
VPEDRLLERPQRLAGLEAGLLDKHVARPPVCL